MEITIAQIKAFAKHKHLLVKGEAIFKQQAIVSFDIDELSLDEILYVNAAMKDDKTYYEVNISLQKDDATIVAHHCSCEYHQKHHTCSHCVAVLWKLKEHYAKISSIKKSQFIQDTTRSHQLLKQYETSLYQQAIQYQYNQQLHIEPVMEIRQKKLLAITLKIGTEKQYIIKNIALFLEDISTQSEKAYGKDFFVLHAYDQFHDDSKKIIDFLYRHEHDTQYFLNITAYQKAVQSRNLCLMPDALDEWFALYENQDVLFRPKEKTLTNMKFLKQNPSIILQVQQEQEGYQLSCNLQDFYIFEGRKHIYIYHQYILYQCDSSFSKNCANFLSQIQKGSLFVDKSLMKRFYQNVLVCMQPHITIQGADLSSYTPSSLTPQIYLDLVKPNIISVKLVFNYGDTSFSAFLKTPTSLQRNYHKELEIACKLLSYVTRVDQTTGIAYIESQDAIFQFLSEAFDQLAKDATLYASDKLKKIQIKKHQDLSIGIRVQEDLLEIQFQNLNFPIQELQHILEAYQTHKKYYRLKDGSFLYLEDEQFQQTATLLHQLHLPYDQIKDETLHLPKYHSLFLHESLQKTHHIEVNRDVVFQDMVKQIQNYHKQTYRIPITLQPILRNYQQIGYQWLKTMASYGFGGILADDMGIGKTLQVITLLEDERIHHPQHISLVVCPSSLILNWKSEIEKFTNNLSCLMISGNAQERQAALSQYQNYHVLITSYDYIKRDISLYESIHFTYFILDEAQYIKNHLTKNALTVKQIHAKYKFALTGTPIENSLSELWSVFDFLMPNYLFSYHYFKNEFEYPIVKEKDEACLHRLQKMVEPFILRRVKKDVLTELPEKIEKTMLIELDEETKKLYAANVFSIKTDLQQLTKQKQATNKVMILSMLTKLRQLCCDPRLLYENWTTCGSKVQACIEFIQSCHIAGKKVLLFSQFTSLLSLMEQELKQNNISYYVLKGSTPKQERLTLVNAFNEDETSVFLISLKAGGTGLNLTGAEVVIHFDPWWNISAQNQATDRAYRMGQHNNVLVVKFVAKDTIEEKIMRLQEKKQDLANAIIQQNEGIITNMTTEEIISLF